MQQPTIILRKTLLPLSLLLFYVVHAQDVTPEKPADYSNNIPVKYVKIWQATAPITNPNVLVTRLLKEVKQTTQYFDGLGRPLQTVMRQGSLCHRLMIVRATNAYLTGHITNKNFI